MSVFRPFNGLRPRRDLAKEIASPPYDVIDSEEARKAAEGDKYTFLHVVKPEIDLDPEIDLYDEIVYRKAAENFNSFKENGWLIKDRTPSFYVYSQKMGDHLQTGIVGCVSVEDYYNNVIRKHEFTRKQKEDDRTRHVATLNANAGPVFLTYRSDSSIDKIIARITSEQPEYDFTSSDGVTHTFWIVDDNKTINEIRGIFEDIPVLYVADGHHRSASAARVGAERKAANPNHTGEEEYNFFLAVLFPHNQLKILPYNRAVKDLAGLSEQDFLKKISESFFITELADSDTPSPKAPATFGMYFKGKWYRLEAKSGSFDSSDPVKTLDVSILQDNLLSPILKIGDPRTDERIKFIGGIRGNGELEKLVDSGAYEVAFSMFPTTVEQLMAIADSGNVMPPKSTWFEPKLRSGLIIHELD